MKKHILALMLLVLAVMLITGCGKGADKHFDILIENAKDVGSLQLTISYDASLVKITEVKAEKLGKNALFEFNKDMAGFLIIGVVDSAGINGSGPIAQVSFELIQEDKDYLLKITEARAYNTNNLMDIAMKPVDGMLSKGKASPPSISFR
jgi:hypothetical protein